MNPTKEKRALTESEMIESLQRSGYLFESEIAKTLQELGFFVEPNQVIIDQLTGKSREIDMTAEYHKYNAERAEYKVSGKIKFVFEIKNNSFPIALLSRYKYSPNTDMDSLFKFVETGVTFGFGTGDPAFYDGPTDLELRKNIFTQYCSFQQKKTGEELMAVHPDELYSGLSKVTQHCEDEVRWWSERDRSSAAIADYTRQFYFLPVILFKGDLYEVMLEDSAAPKLISVDCSRFIFNYHYNEKRSHALVYFLTQKGLVKFLEEMIIWEEQIERDLFELKKAQPIKKVKKFTFSSGEILLTSASFDLLTNLFDSSIKPLFEKLIKTLMEFDTDFLSANKYWYSGNSVMNTLSELGDFWNEEQNLRSNKDINFQYRLSGYKKAGVDAFDIVVHLTFTMEAYWYGFTLTNYNRQQPFIRKMYHESLENEIDEICDMIREDIMNNIETRLQRIG
ncbi:MAG: hypothetical protein M9904_10820 [Chitinophagaceae bacterium]|nr:hypothetical protein [Chitinophagaceae bacterium]